jgi:hypothetical protein
MHTYQASQVPENQQQHQPLHPQQPHALKSAKRTKWK